MSLTDVAAGEWLQERQQRIERDTTGAVDIEAQSTASDHSARLTVQSGSGLFSPADELLTKAHLTLAIEA
jgi:hypothetical protein